MLRQKIWLSNHRKYESLSWIRSNFRHRSTAAAKNEEVSYYISTTKKRNRSKFNTNATKSVDMSKPFPGIPPLKYTSHLEKPGTLISALPSGLRVASQENYGQLSTFGIFVNVGSHHEDNETQGIVHLLEAMSFKSTKNRDQHEIVSELESMGATVTTHSSREQMLCCIDVLRENLEKAMDLLSDCILNPAYLEHEIEEQKVLIGFQMENMTADMIMKESIHQAAYFKNPLGRPHFCTQENMARLTSAAAKKFREKFFTAPNMVLAAAGVNHEQFSKLAEKYFAPLKSTKDSLLNASPTSKYTGGLIRLPGVSGPLKEEWTRMSIAFEVGGWKDPYFVPTCVLQTLLGGGDSFSGGGPGKGMYSRLYREVLNRYFWAESAESFTSMHTESGLLGIAGASAPANAAKLLHVFASHIGRLTTEHVSAAELNRAKNMLKCNLLTQLESRLVLFEDIGRQVLSYGYREKPEEYCNQIDRVSSDDIVKVAQRMMSKPPSIACIGDDTSAIPEYEDIIKWFS